MIPHVFIRAASRANLVSVLAGASLLCPPVLSAPNSNPKPPIDFNRDIRPILAENCYACHGPDRNKRKAGLRLDLAETATSKLESGDYAVVPGDVSKSKLLRLVSSQDEDEQMPPKKTGRRLNLEQIELLRDWIDQGAEWKPHWAYIPPERPAIPSVKNKSWPRNNIDHFILARLEEEELTPSPEAEKHTLIRRVSFDLTGLPPTVSEVDAYLADQSDAAYEKVVDRLLASPHYGERMSVHWLDLARYADSDGYHADIPRSMWQYRDYVINSFNSNKPFDQFTVEQLAGDLLPDPTLDQRIATAFNRNGMSSTEGGADPDEYMNKYVTDRVNTTGTVWLGSTIGCAECHDHKYDPFTQKEYYQLYDFFNQIPERGLDSDPAPPFVKVPTPEQSVTLASLRSKISGLEADRKAKLEATEPGVDAAQKAWEQQWRKAVISDWKVVEPAAQTSSGGATLTRLPDQSLLASGPSPDQDTYHLTFQTPLRGITGFRLEALVDETLPGKGASRSTNGNFVLSEFEVEARSADITQEPAADDGLTWGTWSVLGPFKAASTKEVFEKAFINEPGVDLAGSYDDGKLRWIAKPEWKDGDAQPFAGENSVSYFHRTIRAPDSGRNLLVSLGSDGGMQLWLNGVKVLGNKVVRGITHDPEEVLLLLQPGDNQLLLKVHHGNGEYGFYFAPHKEPVRHYPVRFASAAADYNQKDFHANAALDGKPDTGWAVDGSDEKNRTNHQALFAAQDPIVFEAGTVLDVRLKFTSKHPQHVLGRFRVAVTTASGLKEFASLAQPVQTLLLSAEEPTAEDQRATLRQFYREGFWPELKTLNQKLAETRKEERDLDGKIPTIRVMAEMPERRVTQVRVRGDYRNKGEAVTADVPHNLPPLPSVEKTNRMALAKWMVDPKHPLVSRVTVNRYWQLYFGTGLVKTGNEFGTQGELPSHPDLLDWLACEFIESGWDVKAMQKRIVMSATYRQSSKPTKELLARDPLNRLLARGPRLRLPAEVIRDNALAVSGLLDRERNPGGPSVRPYQPPGLWEDKMFGGNKYEEDKGANLYRRSLYTLWKRTVLNPTLMTFDAPDRAICTDQRGSTCTPLQAFVTLNEKTFVEASRVFAERIMREGGAAFPERLDYAYRIALARPPSAKEQTIVHQVYQDMEQAYQSDLKGALDLIGTGESKRAEGLNELQLVAWTTVANMILNLDETVTKE